MIDNNKILCRKCKQVINVGRQRIIAITQHNNITCIIRAIQETTYKFEDINKQQ